MTDDGQMNGRRIDSSNNDLLKVTDAVDACRTGAELAEPELLKLCGASALGDSGQAMLERCRRLDARISLAMHDVPVPAGLAARIVDRLLQSAPVTPTRETDPPVYVVPAAEKRSSASASYLRGRSWIVATAIAASLLLACFLMLRPTGSEPITSNNYIDRAMSWQVELEDPGVVWNSDVNDPRLEQFPIQRIRYQPTRWLDATSIVGAQAVAYSFDLGDTTATLFVIKLQEDAGLGFTSFPPAAAEQGSGGKGVAAWQPGETLYVAVLNDPSQYQELVDTNTQFAESYAPPPEGRSCLVALF